MTTAREKLMHSLSLLLMEPYTQEKENGLRRLLNTYRVQFKNQKDYIKQDVTARDSLLQRVIDSWQQEKTVDPRLIGRLISPFRMQIKKWGKRSKLFAESSSFTPCTTPTPTLRNKWPQNAKKYESAYFHGESCKGSSDNNYQIAGGPNLKNNSRGNCPKCRSLGLVLSRSYEKADCYSCIYCGFQSYPEQESQLLDLHLAARLLEQDSNDTSQGGNED